MKQIIRGIKSYVKHEFFVLFLKGSLDKKVEFSTIRSGMDNFEDAFLKYLKDTRYSNCFYLSYGGVLLPIVPKESTGKISRINLYVPYNGYNYKQSRFEVFFTTNNLNVLSKSERFFYLKNMQSFYPDTELPCENLLYVDFFNLKF